MANAYLSLTKQKHLGIQEQEREKKELTNTQNFLKIITMNVAPYSCGSSADCGSTTNV